MCVYQKANITTDAAITVLKGILILFVVAYPLTTYIATFYHFEQKVSSATPSGTIYYVSLDGNNNNPGTESQPWQSISFAASASSPVSPGDTVYVKAGTYDEQIFIEKSGSAMNYITFKAYPGESVMIEGNRLSIKELWNPMGLVEISGKNYIKISGFEIINSPQAGVHIADGSDHIIIENNTIRDSHRMSIKVGWDGASNIVISNNTIDRANVSKYEESISVSGADNIEISYNKIFNNMGEGIDIKDGSTHGTVHHNIVNNTTSAGIYMDAYSDYEHDIEIYNNIVTNAGYAGISIGTENGGTIENVKIHNNLVYNNNQDGIEVSNYVSPTSPNPGTARNIEISNNVAYNNGNGGIEIGYDRTITYNIIIKNNILSQNNLYQLIVYNKPSITNVTVTNNLIDGFRNYEGEDKSGIISEEFPVS